MFNKHLKQNDGLLIDWIARKEQIDYEKAQRRLALFCEEIKVRLNQKQKVDFGKSEPFRSTAGSTFSSNPRTTTSCRT